MKKSEKKEPTPIQPNEGLENRKVRRRRLTDRLETLRERTHMIELELQDYTSDWFRVCIFGSARIKPEHEVYKLVQDLAFLLGGHGIDVLTGGGPGLMQAAAKGVQAGGESAGSKSKSFGIQIDLGRWEPPNEHLDIKRNHKKFSSRLDDFMRLSNAVLVTPGGIGTLLELYFTWQLLQVGHITDRPLILLKKDFWEGIIDWMQDKQVDGGLVSPGDFRWVHVVDTPEEAMVVIEDEMQKFNDRRVAAGLDAQ